MNHGFVWRLDAAEPARAAEQLMSVLTRTMAFDTHMTNATVEASHGCCIVKFQYQGRDRWWVYSRARHAMVTAAVRAKIPHKGIGLLRVERVSNGHDLKKPNRTPAQQAADLARRGRPPGSKSLLVSPSKD